jgi:hypothetical protein
MGRGAEGHARAYFRHGGGWRQITYFPLGENRRHFEPHLVETRFFDRARPFPVSHPAAEVVYRIRRADEETG